jgi:hypothetical protein
VKEGITIQDKLFSVVQGSVTTGTVAAPCYCFRQETRNIFLVGEFLFNIRQNSCLASCLNEFVILAVITKNVTNKVILAFF